MRRQHEFLTFDPEAVQALNRILVRCDPKIVISSSWRHGRSVDMLAGILEGYGVHTYMNRSPSGRVIDKTVDYVPGESFTEGRSPERGDEVKEWLDRNTWVSAYAILDDGDDFGVVMDRLVKTDYEHGLTHDHVERVVELLSKPIPALPPPSDVLKLAEPIRVPPRPDLPSLPAIEMPEPVFLFPLELVDAKDPEKK